MSLSTVKRSEWFRVRCENGCQICGKKFPGRNNNGLVAAHIIEKGPKTKINFLALCSNCEKSFDKIIKPAIYNAISEINKGKIPNDWKNLGDP